MLKKNALFFDLVKIGTSDLNQVVRIHQVSFPNFFLTQLGSRVLTLFYKGLINDPNTISWGISNEGNLVGFFVASLNSKGLYKRIVKKNMFFFYCI